MRIKRVCTLLMTVVLSLLVLQLTVGVTFARCLHSGKLRIVSLEEKSRMSPSDMQADYDCAEMKGTDVGQQPCMEYTVEQLAAAEQAPVVYHDFTADQPLLFALWSLLPPLAQSSSLPRHIFCPDKVPIPPRAYLARIRILLI